MKRFHPAWSLASLAAAGLLWTAVPTSAQGLTGVASGGGGSSSGGSVSSGGSSGGSVSSGSPSSGSGGSASSSGSSGGSSGGYVSGGYSGSGSSGRDNSTGSSGYAAPRHNSGSSSTASRGGSNGGGRTNRDRDGGTNNGGGSDHGRSRDGKPPIGNAVPRGSVPSNNTNRGGLIFPSGYYGGYFDPWWYGPGYSGYYGGYYDPWFGGYPSYGSYGSYGSGGSGTYTEEGTLRLKIKPREAEVYQDGFFVGLVDDFDGLFQRLHIETGTHRIEIRAPGYEPLVIDVRIAPDHLTTYQGELKKIQ